MAKITSSEIVDIIVLETLHNVEYALELGLDHPAVRDQYITLNFEGPPGVGKTALQRIGFEDALDIVSKMIGVKLEPISIAGALTIDEGVEIARKVVEEAYAPYLHLHLSNQSIWNIEGTPAPYSRYVEIKGVKVPLNEWRLDPYILPLLDYSKLWKKPKDYRVGMLVLDEYNMADREVLKKIFQLTRSAEMGHARLNPLTIISLVGNTSETNVYVRTDIPLPLKNRMQRYTVVRADLSGWLRYMNRVYGDKYDKLVASYLVIRPENLYYETGEEVVTPRTWSQLSTRLYTLRKLRDAGTITEQMFQKRMKLLIYSMIPEEIAGEFLGFYKVSHRLDLRKIWLNPSELRKINDKIVLTWVLLELTRFADNQYRKAKYVKQKNSAVRNLIKIINEAIGKLGDNAVVEVVNASSTSLRLALYNTMPEHLKKRVFKIAREVREIEKELAKASTG